MTPNLSALADCVLSGQVPAEAIPSLCKDNPGLAEELSLRSSAATLGASRCDAAGVRVSPTHADPRSINSFDLIGQAALPLSAGEEIGRNPIKSVGLISKFFSSVHLPSLPHEQWRK